MDEVKLANLERRCEELGRIVRQKGSETENLRLRLQRESEDRRKTEQTLALVSARLDHLIATSPGIVVCFEAGGDCAVTSISDRVTDVLGYAPREFVVNPRFWQEHLHPDDAPRVFAELRRLREPGVYVSEYRFRHKDGGYRWMRDELSPVSDAAGRPLEVIGYWTDVSSRRRTEEDLGRSETLFRATFDATTDGVIVWDRQHRCLYANKAALNHLGVTREQVVCRRLADVPGTDPEFARLWTKRIDRAFASGEGMRVVDAMPAGKQVIYTESTVSPIRDPSGAIYAAAVVYRDITDRKKAEQEIRRARDHAEQLYRVSPSAIFTRDAEGRIASWNEKAEEIAGYHAAEVAGRRLALFAGEREDEGGTLLARPVRGEECTLVRKDGRQRTVLRNAGELTDENGATAGVIESFEDITERKELEEKLRSLSLVDELTGLYNRRGFFMLAEQQLRLSRRTQRELFVLFADLDGMKTINDSYGHLAGDRALMAVAAALRRTFRESDIVARIGGDEFAVLVLNTAADHADALVTRLREDLRRPRDEGGAACELKLSVGIAPFDPAGGAGIDELIARADKLMYEDKRRNRAVGVNGVRGGESSGEERKHGDSTGR